MNLKIILFPFVTILLIVISFYIAFIVVNKKRKKDGLKELTKIQFLNRKEKLDLRTVLVGMSFGIVFGFIDNVGLWFGLDAFQRYLPGGLLTKSAWGNTYSDALGASFGTCVIVVLKTYTNIRETPIWADTLGVIIGCILGLYIPKVLTGKE